MDTGELSGQPDKNAGTGATCKGVASHPVQCSQSLHAMETEVKTDLALTAYLFA